MSDLESIREVLRVDDDDWMTEDEAMARACLALKKVPGFLKVDAPRILHAPDGRTATHIQVWFSGLDGMQKISVRTMFR